MLVYDGMILAFILIGSIIIIVSFLYGKYSQSRIETQQQQKTEQEDKRIDYDEVTGKIIELNEYGEFLKEELETKHKELLFMYQMILDKQKEFQLTTTSDGIEDPTPSYIKSVGREDLNQGSNNSSHRNQGNMSQQDTTGGQNFNKKIIDLTLAGYSKQEIAKKLDIGVGQVELVQNLYK